MRATIVKQHSSFDFYGKFFTIFFSWLKYLRKLEFWLFFSTSKIKPWHINILSQNEVLVPVWIFFIRIVKKRIIFLLFDWKILPVRYDQFLFLARSATRPSEKRLQAFFSATPAATPSVICVACTMPRTFFMFSN